MNNRKQPKLIIVIPCYNEQEVLPITAPMFLEKINSLINQKLISSDSKIMFVNDGSKDNTWNIIQDLAKSNDKYIGITQSRNRGHQSTVLAGLMEAKDMCDITISIDCDGQDDINAMDEMVKEYLNGCDVVYGVRNDRETDTAFKKNTAQAFYKILNFLGAEVVYNHADYRLLSSRFLNEFANFEEVNIFLRGMVPLVGFKSTSVYYKREERIAGESKYPLSKMLGLAIDGITSLSIKPIRIITSIGVIVSLISFILMIWAVIQYFKGDVISGWSSTVVILTFLGGIQILSIGLVGEYIGKIYMESKNRPRYIISERTYEK
ncbi:MAG: glycosyltransferase family 2 protein [Erysipelotrichaceae bacterium]|nr:glycosyltransferase family 2 protein [Erysipelotrichaceae bacterium]